MKIRAQIGMVLNLDKCIGCHTCSVTCKNVWTSREGMEYAWFNNVETKPGIGYPKEWENQKRWFGGWERTANGEIRPKQGGKWRLLAKVFGNPHLPEIDDYYEPWTYDYEHLHTAPESRTSPIARPVSAITGDRMEKITWGPNWEEILGGEFSKRSKDYNFDEVQKEIYGEFENTFMMYLPRLCEHCLNPACVASCPTGAIYKREEDGIVLIDQDKCRGWRMCVSGCPYKKIYYNWKTGKSEKCIFCYPRIEAGLPTVCSETCVGRIRYLGVVLYDADRIKEAASAADEEDLYESQLAIFLDPNDPAVERQALADGVPYAWIEAARRSPVYKMAMEWKVAFPLHPEYRTLPMVWYVPPLSPVQAAVENGVVERGDLIPDIESLRIPMKYLANLLTGGKVEPVALALKRMLAMRSFMKRKNIEGVIDTAVLEAVGMDQAKVEEMYRIMAIANYEERYVIPTSHREQVENAYELRGGCGFSFGDGCASGGITGGVPGEESAGAGGAGGQGHGAAFARAEGIGHGAAFAGAPDGHDVSFNPAQALGMPATGTLVTKGNLFSRVGRVRGAELRMKVQASLERRRAEGGGPTLDEDGTVRVSGAASAGPSADGGGEGPGGAPGRFGTGMGQEFPGIAAPGGTEGARRERPWRDERAPGGPALSGA